MSSPDPEATRTAQRFSDEMGGMAIAFECFARRWSCSASIAANIDEFREEMHELLLAMAVRIERENLCLYPLVEACPRKAA
jgi:hypothetical protein